MPSNDHSTPNRPGVRNAVLALAIAVFASVAVAPAAALDDTSRGDAMVRAYFRDQSEQLRKRSMADVDSLEAWQAQLSERRRRLYEMLGLDPLPPRTDLQVKITGVTEHEAFRVERLHFQSMPGLYVTANLYVPNDVEEPLPAILYVCGHGRVIKDGVSYGNKVYYQHHGAWFAQHGYVCLTIDTVQLGEIQGTHHGTYRKNMWWWLNRGYTPAGVEAWNCIRALDYLETRTEVDSKRMGVTGRSGGGAYSWWIAALDARIQCAVPVAGITDLQNLVWQGMPGHYPDGCINGHCDCMFMSNTYGWDFAEVAALVAPRPLLISNTDSDQIFPLDGVYRIFEQTRRIYRLHESPEQVALQITAGGHKDTQELRVHAFRWFDKHLKGEDHLIRQPAEKLFQPQQLRVLQEKPADQRNETIEESFIAVAELDTPDSAEVWLQTSQTLRKSLQNQTFRGWPRDQPLPNLHAATHEDAADERRTRVDFDSQQHVTLPMVLIQPKSEVAPRRLVVRVAQQWPVPDQTVEAATQEGDIILYVVPRGWGPSAWNSDERVRTHIRRRFALLGQTLDGQRAYDVRRALQCARSSRFWQHAEWPDLSHLPISLQARDALAGVALYASLFEPPTQSLVLHNLPADHRHGPYLLNVRKFMNVPQAVAMAVQQTHVRLVNEPCQPAGEDVAGTASAESVDETWAYPRSVARLLGRPLDVVSQDPSAIERTTREAAAIPNAAVTNVAVP